MPISPGTSTTPDSAPDSKARRRKPAPLILLDRLAYLTQHVAAPGHPVYLASVTPSRFVVVAPSQGSATGYARQHEVDRVHVAALENLDYVEYGNRRPLPDYAHKRPGDPLLGFPVTLTDRGVAAANPSDPDDLDYLAAVDGGDES